MIHPAQETHFWYDACPPNLTTLFAGSCCDDVFKLANSSHTDCIACSAEGLSDFLEKCRGLFVRMGSAMI